MKRVVLTFGLIAAAIFALLMPLETKLSSSIGTDNGEILGYTTMFVAFLMIFFGIRSYRENVNGGLITFRRAFEVGILIALIASAGYVVTWEILYYNFMPDFGEKYAQATIEKAKKSGASPQQIAEQTKKMAEFAESYKNPVVNSAYTFIEAFPVGFVFTLISAGILRRKTRPLSGSAGNVAQLT